MTTRWFRRTRLWTGAVLAFLVPALALSCAIAWIEDHYKHRIDELIDFVVPAVAAALLIWLPVWLVNRYQPGRRFWFAAAICGALFIYALSFGLACRLCEDGYLDGHGTWIAYRPMTWLTVRAPYPVRRVLWTWVNLFREYPTYSPAYPISHELEVQYPHRHWL